MASLSGDLGIKVPKALSPINTASGGLGIAIDPQANVAGTLFGFAGKGVGGVESLTGNYTTSSAQNFHDFQHFFGEANLLAGYVYGGDIAKFSNLNGSVTGTTYSGGEVTGGQAAAGPSYTLVSPSLNLDDLGGC